MASHTSAVYTAYEFSKFTQQSHHHGFLFKKSNGLKYLIPQKRYFVLFRDNLYWFKQEKTRFIFKGVISLSEAIWVGMNDKCLHLQKNADGKTYLLSGNDIEEWASILGPMLNQPEEKRASSLGKLDQKQILMESRAYKTCPDVFSSESLAGLSDDEEHNGSYLKHSSFRTSCGRTNSTGLENLSLPNSSAGCSVLDPNESGPSTPNFNHGAIDLEDDFLEDGLVGLPPFAKDTVERHLSQIESSIHQEIFREGAETAFTVTVDPASPHFDEADEPPEDMKRASSVKGTVALFEKMSVKPKKKRKRKKRRARVWSQVSSAKKNLKHIKRDPSQGGDLLPGSCSLEEEAATPVIADVMEGIDDTDSLFWTDSESSLSDIISRKNLESSRTLDDLATSLKSMMDTLNNLTSSIQSQTIENLFLFEEATNLVSNTNEEEMPEMFTDKYLDEYHKTLRRISSDPQIMRIPTSQLASDFFSTHRRSTLDPTLHRGSSLRAPSPSLYRDDSHRSSMCSDGMYSRGSTVRIPNLSIESFYSDCSFMDSDSFDDLDAEDFEDILTEDVQEVAEYIQNQIKLQKSVSMINLANQFKHKQLTLETLKNLYSTVRGRMSIDKRVKRRQAHENVSDLNMVSRQRNSTLYENLSIPFTNRQRNSTLYEDLSDLTE